MKKNITIPTDLFIAINHLCTYRESKILFAALNCHDGILTSTDMIKLTGISKTNNYFKARKQLLNLGYLTIDDNGMNVNADKIIADYAKLPS